MLNESKLKFIECVLSFPEHLQIMEGGRTHAEAVKIAVGGTARLVTFNTWQAAVIGLLPEGYGPDGDRKGNLIGELRDIYDWGLEHSAEGNGYKPYDPGSEGPIPLGCTKDDRFAFLDQRLNVIKIKTAKQLANSAELLELGTRAFWKKVAPADSPSGYSAHAIADLLIQASLIAGKIDPSRLRGIGAWQEKDGTVVRNFSGPLPPRGWYVYTRFEEFENLEGVDVDPTDVLHWLERFKWKNPDHAIALFGWLCYAPICGGLKSRPHIFLTGAKNTGKTTLLIGIEDCLVRWR